MGELKDLNQLALEMAHMSPRARAVAMKIGKKERTERGFSLIQWRDRYGQHCRLQKSSLATGDCIWLGTQADSMHLTRKQAGDLAALLSHFAERSELP